jgi:phosphoglycerate dehydrogenase-like enzyme
MLKGIYIIDERFFHNIYGPRQRDRIDSLVDIYAPPQTTETVAANPNILNDADVIISGWHMPVMDRQFFEYASNLKAVFYGAGSTKYFITDQVWERDVIVCHASEVNSLPVAEFTLGQILLSLKSMWYHSRNVRDARTYVPSEFFGAGLYGSTVGLISLGSIARYLCRLLEPFNVNIIAYDPYVDAKTAQILGVELCDLDEVFRCADVVSLHTPLNEQTVGLIRGSHLLSMKPYTTFINTARAPIVEQDEMIEALKERSDLTALLDVTSPEPPERDSPLYELKNVVLTPHIAGSVGNECRRLGDHIASELQRYVRGERLVSRLEKERAMMMA